MRTKTSLLIALLLISLMAFLLPVSAAEAATDKQSAYNAIESAKQDMQEMQGAGFSVKKVNDTIADAKNIYDVQVMLEQKGEKADYSSVIAKANSIGEIKKDAFETHDALRALDLKLEEAGKSQDMSAAIEIFNEAKREFEDERYEQAREAIDRCYEKINELQATFTKIKAIYEASTKTLAGFFARNYKLIIAIILVALVLYFTFKNKVAIYLVNRNIQRLQLEKETLTEMMKKAQFDYFQKGAMPESMYNVRVTKFGELTRDIERRLSIERLELEDIKKRKGKRAEKIRKIVHPLGLCRTKEEINKAKEHKKEKAEEKRRKKLRIKLERKRAKEEEARRKEAKKRAKLRKKAEKKKFPEPPGFHRKFKKHFERLEKKKLPKEERIRKKKEEAARRKEEAREKAEAVRLAERELAITQREEKKQEKLARKKAIKRLKEVKKELKRREKEALKQKKLEKIKKKKSKKK